MSGNKKNIKNNNKTKVIKKSLPAKNLDNSSKKLTKNSKVSQSKIFTDKNIKTSSSNSSDLKSKKRIRDNKKIIKIISKKKNSNPKILLKKESSHQNLSANKLPKNNPKKKFQDNNVINFIDWSKVNISADNKLTELKEIAQIDLTKINSSNFKSLFKKLKNNNLISNSDICALTHAKKRIERYLSNRRSNNTFNRHNLHDVSIFKPKNISLNRALTNKTKH
ncbi:MAG: hypothetical protein ACKO47_01155 [Alphaproteobacteria bacterium]